MSFFFFSFWYVAPCTRSKMTMWPVVMSEFPPFLFLIYLVVSLASFFGPVFCFVIHLAGSLFLYGDTSYHFFPFFFLNINNFGKGRSKQTRSWLSPCSRLLRISSKLLHFFVVLHFRYWLKNYEESYFEEPVNAF